MMVRGEEEEMMTAPLRTKTLDAALKRRNAREVAPFKAIVKEYGMLLKGAVENARELAACALRVESLRAENADMKQMVKDGEVGANRAAEAEEMMDDYRKIQAELAQAYKEKSAQTEKLLAAKAEADRLREEGEAARSERDTRAEELRASEETVEQLQKQLEEERQATETASFEVENRRNEYEDNRRRVEALTKENNELVKRIKDMKEKDARELNKMNDVYNNVIQSAKTAELEAQSRLESIKRQAARVARQASTSVASASASAENVREWIRKGH